MLVRCRHDAADKDVAVSHQSNRPVFVTRGRCLEVLFNGFQAHVWYYIYVHAILWSLSAQPEHNPELAEFRPFFTAKPGSRIWGGAGCVAVSDHLNRVSCTRISRSEFKIGAKGVYISQVSLRPTSEDTSLHEPTPLLVKLPHAKWRYEFLCNLTSGGKNVD
jgi:hypothetical protein